MAEDNDDIKPARSLSDPVALMLAEYEYFATSYWRNEELGEKRVSVYVALAGGLGAVVALLLSQLESFDLARTMVLLALGVLAVFGLMTFLRIVQRNIDADEYRSGMALVKRWFDERSRRGELAFYYDPHGVDRPRSMSLVRVGRGGWLETVGLINSLVIGALTGLAIEPVGGTLGAAAAVIGLVLSWIGQAITANRIYRSSGVTRPSTSPTADPKEKTHG